jgi:heme O synthase-like polyprenyltransferase
MKKFIFSLLGVLILPAFTFAAGTLGTTTTTGVDSTFIDNFVLFLQKMIRQAPAILVGIAGLVFMYEVLKFILTAKDGKAEEKEQNRKHLMYSLVALAVLISFWGIVGFMLRFFGLSSGDNVTQSDIPKVDFR